MAPKTPVDTTKAFHLGQRLSYAGALCTVRFYGVLKESQGEWLGVEWDDTSRGRHDGKHKGERIFSCLSPASTAASFLRPSRRSDVQRTFIEALHQKYASGTGHSNEKNGFKPSQMSNENSVKISSKLVEEVGFDRIEQQQAMLENLSIVILDRLCLTGATTVGSLRSNILISQEQIRQVCPEIIELDLGWNLIEQWQDVADICSPLKRLRCLKASGLRLRTADILEFESGISPFQNVEELYLDETLLTAEQILEILGHEKNTFPTLKMLSLSRNNLSSFSRVSHDKKLADAIYPTVTTLNMDSNGLSSLRPLSDLLNVFPNLTSISLRDNQIDKAGFIGDFSSFLPNKMGSLETINLSSNLISDYSFVDSISQICPSLKHLRVSRNPLYSNKDTPNESKAHSNVVFSLVLARLPSLESLNYTSITARDREEGEIYYLSVTEKSIESIFRSPCSDREAFLKLKESVESSNHHYVFLCEKYDRESIFTRLAYHSPANANQNNSATRSSPSIYPPGSLGARCIKTTFYIPSTLPSNSPNIKSTTTAVVELTRLLPGTISTYTLKSLVLRSVIFAPFDLRPLQYRLVYESHELDPVREGFGGAPRSTGNWDDWGNWDCDQSGKEEHEVGPGAEGGTATDGRWVDGILYKNGTKWKKREVELVDGTRNWGYWIEDDVKEARIRVEILGNSAQ